MSENESVTISAFEELLLRCQWLSFAERFLALAAFPFMTMEEISSYQESLIRESKLRGSYIGVDHGN